MTALASNGILILIPVFNDWEPVALLLAQLDSAVHESGLNPEVLLIDDGSTEPVSDNLRSLRFQSIASVDILTLRRNLGSQRALAVGLCYVEAQRPCRAVVVMDGDGEDAAADVPKLLQKFDEERGEKAVFARRIKRSESWWFRAGYTAYRILHPLLTGIAVRVGNFCVCRFRFSRGWW
jgi:glycosyltransferase involved in cell wall biosynthesis